MTTETIWDNHIWDALPPLETDTTCDLCVIGLGGSGLAAILEALPAGAAIIGIDAVGVGAGAAGRNGGFMLAGLAHFYHEVVAQYGRLVAAKMYGATLEEIEYLHALTPDMIRLTGSLRIAMSPNELEDCALQKLALKADGFLVQSYEGAEGSGLLFPTDGTTNPLARVRALAQLAIAQGARLFEATRALQIQTNLVRGQHFCIRAKKIIVAVDGKLEQIFPQLAPKVRTARLQMLGTAPTALRFTRPIYARFGYEYWQQLPNGCIALGGLRDYFEQQEWTSQDSPTDNLQTQLEHFLRETLGINADITHRWAASVSYSNQLLPVLQEVSAGVWALGGYSGTGNVVGSIFGRLAAQLALGKKSALESVFLRAS